MEEAPRAAMITATARLWKIDILGSPVRLVGRLFVRQLIEVTDDD
jgi:hypothetical protein